MSEVAVLVLNYQKYDQTKICLDALHALEAQPAVRIYLIDNASEPQDFQRLMTEFPDVTALPLTDNLGYSGGMNAGIRQALEDGAEHIVLLNNDTQVAPPALRQMLAIFENKHLNAGIVGPSLRTLPPNETIQALGLDVNRWSGRVTMRHFGVSPELTYPYPHQADAISGACLMISRAALESIGLLNDDYFFYFEDVDLSLRVREAGYQVFVVPNAVVYHEGGATMGLSPERCYYGVRNQLKVINERGLKVSFPVAAGRNLFIVGMHMAQAVREQRGARLASLRSVVRGVKHHRKGRYGPAAP